MNSNHTKPAILFISTLNLATNPRLFKEIKLALANGYSVHVLCFEFDNWSYGFNQQLKKEISDAELTIIFAGRKPFLPWAISVLQERTNRSIAKVISLSGHPLSQAVSRRSNLLLKQIRKMNGKYDLVIGHNPGALYPTYFAGKKFHCKTGFDVEDYHPGETNDATSSARILSLLKTFLPKMDYLTFASAPILNEVRKIGDLDGTIIMNWFSSDEFSLPAHKEGNLKLVWFSQNISFNRGLEIILPALENIDGLELHLFGNCNPEFQDKYLTNLRNVFLHPALSQKALHKRLSEFDCGLAIEPKKDFNNDLAVSNKILAYFQAGLFIIASDTMGQSAFLKNHSDHGELLQLDDSNLTTYFIRSLQAKEAIRERVQWRYNRAQGSNWETESKKLLNIWKQMVPKGRSNHHCE